MNISSTHDHMMVVFRRSAVTADNHQIIIWMMMEYQYMIISWSYLEDQHWQTVNDSSWLSNDYQIINRLSTFDHFMIMIRRSAEIAHDHQMIAWILLDYHHLSMTWRSAVTADGHGMITRTLTDYQQMTNWKSW